MQSKRFPERQCIRCLEVAPVALALALALALVLALVWLVLGWLVLGLVVVGGPVRTHTVHSRMGSRQTSAWTHLRIGNEYSAGCPNID